MKYKCNDDESLNGCEYCGDAVLTYYKERYGFICDKCLRKEEEDEDFKKHFCGPSIPWYFGYTREEIKINFKQSAAKEVPESYYLNFDFAGNECAEF